MYTCVICHVTYLTCVGMSWDFPFQGLGAFKNPQIWLAGSLISMVRFPKSHVWLPDGSIYWKLYILVVCIYMYKYICIHIQIYIHIYIHIHIYKNMYIYIQTYLYIHTYTYTNIYIYKYIHLYMHIYIYRYIYIYIATNTYIYT